MLFRIKQVLQRVFRRNHTADSDLWSLDIHLAEIIATKLKAFRSLELQGYPSDFTEPKDWPEQDNIPKDLVGGGPEKWLETIDEMIYAFEQAYMYDGDKQQEFLDKYNLKDPWRDTDFTKFPLSGDHYWGEIDSISARAIKGRMLFSKYFTSL